jgi:NADP-dependent 3-hydroxy acid dehydrogenase YdfG
MSESLTHKVIVITGASSGIGAGKCIFYLLVGYCCHQDFNMVGRVGIALALVKEGAKVVLGARRLEALEEVKASIVSSLGETSKERILLVKTDVSKREDVHALVAKANEGFGPVDILVNNGK